MYELAGIIALIAYIAIEIYGLLQTEKPKAKNIIKTNYCNYIGFNCNNKPFTSDAILI